ncbi:MAG TPA: shikimate dehydrogenase [Stellaceae bacterium]|nr:shikimate dehydrogenase [Stellaceae bacterium]
MTDSYRLAAVMGWPVAHSRSPVLHRYWLDRHGLAGDYVKLAVPPDRLGPALRGLANLGFAGCNLTLPHKEAALGFLDEIDPQARAIGAVNTVTVLPDGKLRGTNSDAFGFIANLKAGASTWQPGAPAVVLGAGGAARAVVASLMAEGVRDLRLVNRHRDRAETLAAQLGAKPEILPWEHRAAALDGAGLLVNATSLGMTGAPPLDLPLDRLPPNAVVNDIVYTPLETELLAAARRRGNPVVDGLGMLIHQGRPGFAAWFGIEPDVTPELRARMVATLAAP